MSSQVLVMQGYQSCPSGTLWHPLEVVHWKGPTMSRQRPMNSATLEGRALLDQVQ